MCTGGDLLIRGLLTPVPQSPAYARPEACSRAAAQPKKKPRGRPSSAPSRRYSWRSDLRSSYSSGAGPEGSPFGLTEAAAGSTQRATSGACQLLESRSQTAMSSVPVAPESLSLTQDLQKARSEHSALRHLIQQTCQSSFIQADETREQMEHMGKKHRRVGKDDHCGPLPTGSAVYDGLIEKNEVQIRKLLDQLSNGITVEDLAKRMRFNRDSQVNRLRQLLKHLADSLQVADEAERRVAYSTWELNSHAAALQTCKAQCKALHLENASLKAERADLQKVARASSGDASAKLGRRKKAEGRRHDIERQISVLKEAAALATAPATAEATPALRRAVQSLMRDNSRAHQDGRIAEQLHGRLKSEEKYLRRALQRPRSASQVESTERRSSLYDFRSRSKDLEAGDLTCKDGKALKKPEILEVILPYPF